MARDLTSGYRTALAAAQKYVGILVEIAYDTPLRVWSGPANLSWDSKTWAGLGDFASMSAITEKIGARADMMKLTLNGVPLDRVALALADTSQGREVNIWAALFTLVEGVWTVIPDPALIAWGETDVHEIIEDDESETYSIEVAVETPLARLTLINALRYTVADHQRLFPGDLFFEYAPQVAEQVLFWPTAEPASAGLRTA